MKKMGIILLCGLIFLVITGCENKLNIGKKSNIELSQSEVYLSIKEKTKKNTGATLILTNKSNKNFQYGNPYEIEVKKDNEWYKIDVNLNFTMPAFYLKANETKEMDINWENGYGKLPKGTYRIIKSIDYENEQGKFERFNIATEFTIE